MIVLTIGSFDLVHSEHISLFKWCSDLAGEEGQVIVGLNPDEFIESYKGKPPVMDYANREAVLKACRWIDEVYPNTGGKNSKELISMVGPAILCIGSDWWSKDYLAQLNLDFSWLYKNRIALTYVPSLGQTHSSDFKETLNENCRKT